MCKVLKVSRSSYYRWFTLGPTNRALEDSMFSHLIKKIFDESSQRYGSPKITRKLRNQYSHVISERRVSRLMKELGLVSKRSKKYKNTTNSNHKYPVSPNLLEQNFSVERPAEVWVSDITYIRTLEGWLYLTIILDLYDRKIIGWSLSDNLETKDTIIRAWKMAKGNRKITDELVFHSDRGIQYASKDFRKIMKKNKRISQSMSRKANCWDNAVAESFFRNLKSELEWNQEFSNHQKARMAIFEYIETWYNNQRIHSSLGYKTPRQVELEYYMKYKVA